MEKWFGVFYIPDCPNEEACRKLGAVSQNLCNCNLICLVEDLMREAVCFFPKTIPLLRLGG